ncbi:MAG: hypothetical protein EOP06_10675 [Proteobacteria bacterium]|nr:MAG: hypothetical protein EOP06_10675 [Pseudomonadota bacterium]
MRVGSGRSFPRIRNHLINVFFGLQDQDSVVSCRWTATAGPKHSRPATSTGSCPPPTCGSGPIPRRRESRTFSDSCATGWNAGRNVEATSFHEPNPMETTVEERLNRLLPAMQSRSQPVPPASTPPPSTLVRLEGWRTLKDPILTQMGKTTGDFIRGIRAGDRPWWLTFWGSPGTGKTFLSRRIYEMRPIRSHWLDWIDLCRRFQGREDIASRLRYACDAPLVIIDDIGAEHITPATLGVLHGLLQTRLGKWTVITSNHSPDNWREMDARIGSRIIRDGNRHVDCRTVDFALRG